MNSQSYLHFRLSPFVYYFARFYCAFAVRCLLCLLAARFGGELACALTTYKEHFVVAFFAKSISPQEARTVVVYDTFGDSLQTMAPLRNTRTASQHTKQGLSARLSSSTARGVCGAWSQSETCCATALEFGFGCNESACVASATLDKRHTNNQLAKSVRLQT